MALLRQALQKNMNMEADFPIKFSKISVDSSADKIVHSIGLQKVSNEKLDQMEFPKKRAISKVTVYRLDEGHYSLMFTALKSPDKEKASSPLEKLIKIDLIQNSYRIIYNASPETNPAMTKTEYVFAGTQPTAEDIYRIVIDIGKQKGKWTEKFNCQAFTAELLQRLATLPGATNWKI